MENNAHHMKIESAYNLISQLAYPQKMDKLEETQANADILVNFLGKLVKSYIEKGHDKKLTLAICIAERLCSTDNWKLHLAIQRDFIPTLFNALQKINKRKREKVVRLLPLQLYASYIDNIYRLAK